MNKFRTVLLQILVLAMSGLAQVSWTPVTPLITGRDLFCVTHDNDQWIAGGREGIIIRSSDGETWTVARPGVQYSMPLIYSITYGDTQFVAVGGGGTIFSSNNDGSVWTDRSNYVVGGVSYLMSIAYGNGVYLTHASHSNTMYTSSDCITWVNPTIWGPPTAGQAEINSIIFVGSQFVAIGGQYGNDSSLVMTSPDGTTWTRQSSGTNTDLYEIQYGDSQFVAWGGDSLVITSPDAVYWTSHTSDLNGAFRSAVYGNDQWVAVGGNGLITTSVDGIHWTTQASGTTDDLYGIAFHDSLYVAVGDGGTILVSPAWAIATEKNRLSSASNSALHARYLAPNALSITIPEDLRSPEASVSIYTIAGKKVYSRTVSASAGEVRISGINLPTGMYSVGIKAKGQRRFAKCALTR